MTLDLKCCIHIHEYMGDENRMIPNMMSKIALIKRKVEQLTVLLASWFYLDPCASMSYGSSSYGHTNQGLIKALWTEPSEIVCLSPVGSQLFFELQYAPSIKSTNCLDFLHATLRICWCWKAAVILISHYTDCTALFPKRSLSRSAPELCAITFP